jgi:hypothetical protein
MRGKDFLKLKHHVIRHLSAKLNPLNSRDMNSTPKLTNYSKIALKKTNNLQVMNTRQNVTKSFSNESRVKLN